MPSLNDYCMSADQKKAAVLIEVSTLSCLERPAWLSPFSAAGFSIGTVFVLIRYNCVNRFPQSAFSITLLSTNEIIEV